MHPRSPRKTNECKLLPESLRADCLYKHIINMILQVSLHMLHCLGCMADPKTISKRMRSYSSNVKSNSFCPSVRQRFFMFTRGSASPQVCSIVFKKENQLPLHVELEAFAALAAAKLINSSIVHLEACAYTRFCFRVSFFKSF